MVSVWQMLNLWQNMRKLPELPYEEVELIFNGEEWVEDHGLKFNLDRITFGTPNELRKEVGLPPVEKKGEDI